MGSPQTSSPTSQLSGGQVGLLVTHWTISGVAPSKHSSGVSPFSILDRIDAAARAGFTGIGFVSEDLAHWEREVGLPAIRTALETNSITDVELGSLGDWHGSGASRQQSDDTREALLRTAHALDIRHLKIGVSFGKEPLETELVTEEFAALCDQFAAHDVLVGLEPMPFGRVKTPADAFQIVQSAGKANGGLVIDIWHTVRAGLDFDVIGDLPKGAIVLPEISDAPAESQAVSLAVETRDNRLLCGEGELDIGGFIAAVRAQGYDGPFGVEILSDEQRARPLQLATRLAFDSARRQFESS